MKLKIKFIGLLLITIFSMTSTNAQGQEGFIGEIRMFAGNFAPRTWAYCDGQLLSIAQNTALFSILGTTYGGDGRTTFALPDLRGRTPIGPRRGPGQPDYRLGQKGGVSTNVLNVTQLPSHTHAATGTVKAANTSGTTNDPTGNVLGLAKTPIDRSTIANSNVYATTANANMAANGVSITVGNTGNNQAINNMQPYLSINYIICTQGVFPSRN